MKWISQIKSWWKQRYMDRMQKRLTKYLQKREKRRVLMEREIKSFLRRKEESRDLTPHQRLQLSKTHFAKELEEERMEVTRDRKSKTIKVILARG